MTGYKNYTKKKVDRNIEAQFYEAQDHVFFFTMDPDTFRW